MGRILKGKKKKEREREKKEKKKEMNFIPVCHSFPL